MPGVTALEDTDFQNTASTAGMFGGLAYDWDSAAASTTLGTITRKSEWHFLMLRNQAHISSMSTNMQVAIRDMGTIMVVNTALLCIIAIACLIRVFKG